MKLEKPKKNKYNSAKKELDKLIREVCFARDKHACLRCGKQDQLAPSHIYPKGTYRRLRWDIDNVKTLCYRCHIEWWHKNPVEANEWLERTIDPERLKKLKNRILFADKSPIDYNLIKLELKQLLKKYENDL